jgi:predicted ATPase
MGYYVKGGELYVTYDKSRKAAVKYLSQRAGFHVLDVSRSNLIEMAARIQARRLINFIDIMKGRYGTR